MSSRIARIAAPFALCCVSLASAPASAQWAWKDSNGHLVFSDRAPPVGTPPSAIVKQPGKPQQPDTPDASAPAAAPAPAPAARPLTKSAAELDAEFTARQQKQAAEQQKAADAAQQSQQKAADCARSRATVQQLQEGLRMRSADGGNMSDDERAAETARLQREISSRC